MFGFSLDSITRSFDRNSLFTRRQNGVWLKREEAIMGTSITVELWSDETTEAEAAIAAVMAEMHRINDTMSPHKPTSELSRINQLAGATAVSVSAEMMGLLTRAAYFSELTGGAFDITYAAVGRLYDYRQRIRPTTEQLAAAREAVGYRNVTLDHTQNTVRFTRPDVCIDLGGFAKGHAIDNAAKILQQRGIAHANLSAGGDSRVIGNRDGRPWSIGIRDPRQEDAIVALLPLEDTSISTSGDYERYFIEDGVRFHHLINPATGISPSNVRAVTILADDGLSAEAFSKSVFVLGVEQGLRLIEAQDDIDAIVVDAEGTLHYSSGLLNSTATLSASRLKQGDARSDSRHRELI